MEKRKSSREGKLGFNSVFSFKERLILELRLNVLVLFLRFDAENVLKMFLNYMPIHYMYFSKSMRK